MKPEIVLCVDSESAMNPELIGLEGENLLAQSWLRLFCSAVEARSYLRETDGIEEVWVASSDEMEPINLAAALKKDMHTRGVYLLAFDGGGSLKSRASAAGIDAAMTQVDFASKYARKKTGAAAGIGGQDGHTDQPACEAVPSLQKTVGPLPAVVHDARSAAALVLDRSQREAGDEPEQAEVSVSASRADPCAVTAKLASKKTASLITVVSACGGSGKSTIAALAAFFCQGFGRKTALLDADLQFGDMQYLVGIEDPLTLDDAASDPALLDRLRPDGARPALLAAPKRLEQSEVMGDGLARTLDRMGSRFDLIIANTSSHWDEQLAQLLERSSRVLFIVDQRASALRASKHALEMCSRCGIATSPFVFAVNRCAKGALFSSFDVACSLGGSQVVELKYGGKEVDELLGAGLPFDLIRERNELCLSLERVLVDLIPKDGEEPPKSVAERQARAKRFSFGKRRRRAACL